jgi:hypothetical protein
MKLWLIYLPITLAFVGCATELALYRPDVKKTPGMGIVCFSASNDETSEVGVDIQDLDSKKYYTFDLTPELDANEDQFYFYAIPAGVYETASYLSHLRFMVSAKSDTWLLEPRQFMVKENTITYIGTYLVRTGGFPFYKTHLKTADHFEDLKDYLKSRDDDDPLKSFGIEEQLTELKEQKSLLNP